MRALKAEVAEAPQAHCNADRISGPQVFVHSHAAGVSKWVAPRVQSPWYVWCNSVRSPANSRPSRGRAYHACKVSYASERQLRALTVAECAKRHPHQLRGSRTVSQDPNQPSMVRRSLHQHRPPPPIQIRGRRGELQRHGARLR
jgi:hypothetical protein